MSTSLLPSERIPPTTSDTVDNTSQAYISGEYVLASVLMAFGMSIGVYGAFVMDCIFTMCDYLGIHCLTVKRTALDRAKKN